MKKVFLCNSENRENEKKAIKKDRKKSYGAYYDNMFTLLLYFVYTRIVQVLL